MDASGRAPIARSHSPRRLATTENERTPIDANERGTKKILPTHPARPQFFDWHAHESHGHRHRAHPQLLCPQAPQVVAFAHAHPPGAHAQLPAHLSHAMTKKSKLVRSFVRSFARESSRARVNAATRRRRQSDEDARDRFDRAVSRRVVCTTSHDSRTVPPSTACPPGAVDRPPAVGRGRSPSDES